MRKFLLVFSLFSLQVQAQTQQEKAQKQFEKFQQYYSLLYSYYVDTVDYNKIIESAISKSLENLDPHSNYLPPKEASSENERLKGSFEGIGISYNIYKDTLNIVEVIVGGPSERVGLLAGDKLLKINDTLWAGKTSMKADDYVSRLRGKKGTKVKIQLIRLGKIIDFTITRDVIPIVSVDAAFMLDNEVGYIKLNKYSGETPKEIDSAIIKLKAKGMKTCVLDLQYNGGGVLNSAVSVSDEFLEKDKMVVFTEGVNSPRHDYKSTEAGLFETGKVIILVNEQSASASEITAGAIQDHDRGLIVGRRTFGKGLVQRPFEMIDKSQLRLTTAKYFTPSGRCIQKPYGDSRKEYRDDILHRSQAGLLTKADTVKVPDSLMFYTINKRKVFGGGGVTPDVYVPIDTTKYSDYYFQVMRKGHINTFCLEYVNENKVKLMTMYPNADYFVSKFEVDSTMLNNLFLKATKDSIVRNDSSIQVSKRLFEVIIKANIGRNLFNGETYYRVTAELDPMIQKAIVISRENFGKYKVRND